MSVGAKAARMAATGGSNWLFVVTVNVDCGTARTW